MELRVSTSNNQLELGKPVIVTLSSSEPNISLDKTDLSPLQADFHIKNISESVWQDNLQQQQITLYPRKTGQQVIPELYFLSTNSQPLKINVTPPIDPKDNTVIDVKTSVSTLTPWRKQQVLVRLQFISQSEIIVFKTPKAYSEHSDIIELNTDSEAVVTNNQSLTRHTTGWAIFPKQAGIHQLELPAVQLVRDGVTTHRFYPPLIKISVKDLPVYIPDTMPVGQLKLRMVKKPNTISIVNNVATADFKLSGRGIMPSNLPSLKSQIKSNEHIFTYPAEVNHKQVTTKQGVTGESRYSLNYKVNQQGYYDFYNFKLNYFDPDSGTIKSIENGFGRIYSVHYGLVVITGIIVTFIFYLAAKIFQQWLAEKWRCFSRYKYVFTKVTAMNNADDIKNSLMIIAEAENWGNNLTLKQWQNQWLKKYRRPCNINLKKLENILYRERAVEISDLKNEIRTLCYNRFKILYLFK
jgi:hypothetical protein